MRPARLWTAVSSSSALALVLAGLVVPAQPAAGAPDDVGRHPLLPDMRSIRAADLHIEKSDHRRRLLFSATLVNIGVGPLEVVPRPGGECRSGERRVDQAIYQDRDRNGVFKRGVDIRRVFREAGCMVFHPAHNHWHIEASAKYKLTRPEDSTPLAKSSKVSFCLRDTVHYQPSHRKAFYGACTRDKRQGITPTWGDLYQWFLPDQDLTLPRSLSRGLYCLQLIADPKDEFRESNETNNASSRAIHIQGTTVRPVDTDRCQARHPTPKS
jgi:hypothetical protein